MDSEIYMRFVGFVGFFQGGGKRNKRLVNSDAEYHGEWQTRQSASRDSYFCDTFYQVDHPHALTSFWILGCPVPRLG